MAGKYKIEPRGLSRDSVNQLNKVFDQIEGDIKAKGSAPTSLTPRQQIIAANAPTPSGPVNLGGSIGTVENVMEVNKGGGSPGPVGPPGPAGGAVLTDGTTIGGDGDGTPLFLEVPVTLADGGTGIEQEEVQPIMTNGTVIAAGTAQAQPPLAIAGVTANSAIAWSLPNSPDASWQTGITLMFVCTAGTVTLYLVNPTANPITPISQIVNVKVIL